MNAANVLVLTSTHEGSPNVVKEALACNLPIVSTDVGDVRERVAGLDNCVVCEDDRPETVAAALEQALDSGEFVNGRDAVLDCDETLLTQHVIRIYQNTLAG